jgi:tetratricopeptide (TPR) repeat protein
MTRNSTRPQTDIAYNSQMRKQAAFIAICAVLLALTQAQTVTVTAVPGPDETISQNYVALDSECRRLVAARQNPADAVSACKKVADEADQFAPQSHFITRRGAFVYYTTSLIQAKEYKAAVSVGDKAVAVVLLGHDDPSGSSAAYGVRGQAKAFAGDLPGADQDLDKAEAYQRNGLNSPAGQALKIEYSRTLKGLLMFHAQVLEAMGNKDAAGIKLEQANTLQP